MDKELALAIDFQKAPPELQRIARDHFKNIKEVAKLKRKIQEESQKLFEAERIAEQSAKELRLALRNWEPEI